MRPEVKLYASGTIACANPHCVNEVTGEKSAVVLTSNYGSTTMFSAHEAHDVVVALAEECGYTELGRNVYVCPTCRELLKTVR